MININNIETPNVLIDDNIVERNILGAQSYFNTLGVSLRPHIKTHKSVELAKRQILAGAIGITCQKTSEAEIFVNAGIKDILITYNVIGKEKLSRLRNLNTKSKITVVADSPYVIKNLSEYFIGTDKPINVLVECDTGLARCGVQTPLAAVELAEFISESKFLKFSGLMTYPAPDSHEHVEDFLYEAKEGCLSRLGSCDTISSGGTPSMYSFKNKSLITEYRPGTYIYNDRSLIARKACTIDDCALSVIATVVSRPTTNRAILDCGSKTLSSDLLGLLDYGFIREFPKSKIYSLSEEHAHVDISECNEKPVVGDKVSVIPNHVCVVTNLFDFVYLHNNGQNFRKIKIDARGLVF